MSEVMAESPVSNEAKRNKTKNTKGATKDTDEKSKFKVYNYKDPICWY